MKKIIAAIDSLKFSESTTNYAVHIAKQLNAHLVGVFLDDPTYTSYKIYDVVVKEGATEARLKQYDHADAETRDEASKRFEAAAGDAGITYSIHHDRGIALQDLLHESVYADLLIIDSHETLTHYVEKQPTRFISDLLSDVQCPVLLVPDRYKPIDKIALLYDGEPSSVYAIKMFSYLFPLFKNLETEVVSVKTPNQTLHLPDNKLMKEFMKRHFPKVAYNVIKGFADIEIVKHLKSLGPNVLVVVGAYRRGRVSRWFHESMADTLVKQTKLPLFIAHQ
jgi:nucleotide-binding universal stress UspA family protein